MDGLKGQKSYRISPGLVKDENAGACGSDEFNLALNQAETLPVTLVTLVTPVTPCDPL